VVNVPNWERLGDAAKRAMLAGIAENEVQLALCRAISNRKIRVRIYLGKFERGDFFLTPTVGVEAGLIIPRHLTPRDFDWTQSSPLMPWRDTAGMTAIFPNWRQDRIEVFSADVTQALFSRTRAEEAQGVLATRKPERAERKPTKRKRKFAPRMQAPVPAAEHGEQQWAPAWEPLSETLARFMSADFSGSEAKDLICRAMRDGRIRLRWRAFTDDQVLSKLPPATAARIRQGLRDEPAAWRGQIELLYPRQFMGEMANFASPPGPDDFNWRESCLQTPQNFGSFVAPHGRRVWIELLQADVVSLLSDGSWLRDNRKEAEDSESRRQVEKTRRRREDRIRQFTESQLRRRDWINFAEIAEWCSELSGSIVSDEGARASGYEKLCTDLMAGDFEECGKTRVLFLHPWTPMAKMTRDRARDFKELAPPETLRSEYWDHCWIPQHLFHRWLAKHNLPTSPSRFEPQPVGAAASMPSRPKTKIHNQQGLSPKIPAPQNITSRRGRRGPAPGVVDRYRESDRALFSELRRIMRKEGKSLYAAALKLAELDKVKGAGTPISRAKRIVRRFNAEQSTPITR